MRHPPFPLRDSTGSHWIQVLRDGEGDWVWCCTICTLLSLSGNNQVPNEPAPHIKMLEHQHLAAEWDGDERHACVRMDRPVWLSASSQPIGYERPDGIRTA